MRTKLATKISAAVVGVVVLAILSSVAALLSAWSFARSLNETANVNLEGVLAAEELELSLLQQRGHVSSYVLDEGNPVWLKNLEKPTQEFDYWLSRAWNAADTDKEKALLERLRSVYDGYLDQRDRVVALYKAGETESAEALLLTKVSGLYDDARDLCEKFIQVNLDLVERTKSDVRWKMRGVMWTVGVCVTLTMALGIAILGLFFYGMLFPLRRMVADARGFAGSISVSNPGLPSDELRQVGAYLSALMSDVADTRSSMEAQRSRLINAEKLATVGKLAATVAHEIRNPLTSIKMWLFSIRKAVGNDPELERKVGIVSEEINRLESIVRNFLEFTRPPAPKLQPQSIPALIDKTLELCGHRIAAKKIQVRRRHPSSLPRAMADSEQLKQVLINLVDNAIEATHEGGEIGISAEAATEASGRDMVIVRVRDSGSGMPEDVAQRVFEPFFTTKEDGTGLGLCIAAGIMSRHGGRLLLESTSSAGTVFAVSTPAAGEQSRDQDPGR